MTTFYVLPNCVGNPLLGTCAVLHLCCVPFLWLLTEFAALHILFFATNNQHFHKPTWSFVTVASVFHIFRNCVVQLTRLLLCGNYSCYYSCGGGTRTHVIQLMRLSWNHLQSTPRYYKVFHRLHITVLVNVFYLIHISSVLQSHTK